MTQVSNAVESTVNTAVAMAGVSPEAAAEVTATKPPKAAKPKAEKAAKPKAEKAPKEDKGPSKKERAVAVFTRMTAEGKPRKEILAAFQTEVGLTEAGANTYYQNIRSAQPKATATESTGDAQA